MPLEEEISYLKPVEMQDCAKGECAQLLSDVKNMPSK